MPRVLISVWVAWLALAVPAFAQAWPARPITLIIPFAPGGGVDASARIQAQQLSEILGPVSYTQLTLTTILRV